ncbi:MAG: glycine cleavage system protein GcvH [Ignavibacteriaceae bacterium]|nr:glycine cleavage system protein GcvH [Ignavibacteriaceae bacterium]
MKFPEDLLYTNDHEWIKVEGKLGTIGITDFAQGELGDVVFVDIDPNLKEIKKGQSFGTIEAVKTVSDLYAPCNGKVVEINSTLTNSPEVVNSDPYGNGWVIKIEIQDQNDLSTLMDSKAYNQLINK